MHVSLVWMQNLGRGAAILRREDRPAHLERLRHADLALDTRAYNSHTLAADYAWAGVPLCTALCDAEPRGDLLAHVVPRPAFALQEAAVAALSLRLCVARHAAELRIHEEHRVARHRHVADHDARWVRLCNRRERVHPAGDVIRHLVLVPQQLRRLPVSYTHLTLPTNREV